MNDDYKSYLSTYVEQISDDFQSTFTVIDHNTLYNMLGLPGDFEKLIDIIKKYIPDAKIEFIKTNELKKEYDIYIIKKTN